MNEDSSDYKKWLEETFELEVGEGNHALGSHWLPFFDDPTEIIKRIPELLPKSLDLSIPFSKDIYKPKRVCSRNWPVALYRAYPYRTSGVCFVIKAVSGQRLELVSMFPFNADGTQHTLTLEKVHVWESGVEAQITANLGEISIDFFDSLYTKSRDWYEAGGRYDFILTGIAYKCRKAIDYTFEIPNYQEFRRIFKEKTGEEWPVEDSTVHTEGMIMFLQKEGYDRDDFSFRGTVHSLKEIEMLGQKAWRAKIGVFPMDTQSKRVEDLNIIITTRAWDEKEPLKVGDEIEGVLWLQGYLCYPHSGLG